MDIRHEFEGNVIVSIERDELPLHQAAPDLLAALEWAVDTADAEQYEAGWYADARMAIAKAKGLV
jgi:hypothetical protein